MVTPALIYSITKAPRVRGLGFPWPLDGTPIRSQMDMEGEEAFQGSTLKDNDRCIYYVMISRVFLVLSLTSITIERARCLYTFLTETLIDFGSFIIATMKGVRLATRAPPFHKEP